MRELISKDMGFVAFVMMQPTVRLKSFDRSRREFTLASEIEMDATDLRARYINSCCRSHDSLVLQLKQLLSGG